MDQLESMHRLVDALENIAAELERLRLLKEHELGAQIEYVDADPYVRVDQK